MGVKSNTLVKRIATKSVFADIKLMVDVSSDFTQGDLVVFNTSSKKIVLAADETDGANFLGVMPVTLVDGKYPAVYNTDVDAAVGTPALPGPEYGSEYLVNIKAGEVLTVGCDLYLDPASGSRSVQVTGTKAVGIYQGKAVTVPTGGLEISMLVGCRRPNDVLKF